MTPSSNKYQNNCNFSNNHLRTLETASFSCAKGKNLFPERNSVNIWAPLVTQRPPVGPQQRLRLQKGLISVYLAINLPNRLMITDWLALPLFSPPNTLLHRNPIRHTVQHMRMPFVHATTKEKEQVCCSWKNSWAGAGEHPVRKTLVHVWLVLRLVYNFVRSKHQIRYRMFISHSGSLFIGFPRLTNTPVKTPVCKLATLKIFSHRGCYGWAEQNKIGLLISLLFCI